MENENNIIFIDGFKIRIKAFYFIETYPNGLPSEKYIHKINKILSSPDYPLEWGIEHPAIINRNTIQYDSNGLLPKYTYTVWLQSDTSINDPLNQYEGSEIICNWFGQAMEPNIPVQQYVTQNLYKFSWLDKAKNIKPILVQKR